MSESAEKRRKTAVVANLGLSLSPPSQERVFFTRDYLVELIIPRLLGHDNPKGIMDLGALYAMCRNTRQIVGSSRFNVEMEAMRLWGRALRRKAVGPNMALTALFDGAMASFRYFLHRIYAQALPTRRDGESWEQAWDRVSQPLSGDNGHTRLRDMFLRVQRQSAWVAGQAGHMEAIRDIATVGDMALLEGHEAQRITPFGGSVFSRPMKIALKAAASRGRTQLCKDIYDLVCRTRRSNPRVHGIDMRHLHQYEYYVRGMKYAAMYGHEETARECMRLAFSPESHYVSESEILGVVCGPLTTLFEELDPYRRQIKSYPWYMALAVAHGQFDMMMHLYKILRTGGYVRAELEKVERGSFDLSFCGKHLSERRTQEEQDRTSAETARCKAFIRDVLAE